VGKGGNDKNVRDSVPIDVRVRYGVKLSPI